MKLYNIKLEIQYRDFDDMQYISVPAQEAHKAYYIFANPEARAIFSNGHALIGKHIKSIVPDYHAALGYNQGYKLTPEDHAIIAKSPDVAKLKRVMVIGKKAAQLPNAKQLLALPLSDVAKEQGLLQLNSGRVDTSQLAKKLSTR